MWEKLPVRGDRGRGSDGSTFNWSPDWALREQKRKVRLYYTTQSKQGALSSMVNIEGNSTQTHPPAHAHKHTQQADTLAVRMMGDLPLSAPQQRCERKKAIKSASFTAKKSRYGGNGKWHSEREHTAHVHSLACEDSLAHAPGAREFLAVPGPRRVAGVSTAGRRVVLPPSRWKTSMTEDTYTNRGT